MSVVKFYFKKLNGKIKNSVPVKYESFSSNLWYFVYEYKIALYDTVPPSLYLYLIGKHIIINNIIHKITSFLLPFRFAMNYSFLNLDPMTFGKYTPLALRIHVAHR